MTNFQNTLDTLISQALIEDLGEGDHSSLSCINPNAKGKAHLKVKEDCTIAGIEVADFIFKKIDTECEFIKLKNDGEFVKNGELAFEIKSSILTILQCERLVLNCMQRMSGIATLTKIYTDKLIGYNTKLLDTRKTTPNFRLLEKEAVKIAGGLNHRFGLYDMMMLKDNHIDFCGGIQQAIESSWKYKSEKNLKIKIEIETRNIEDVKKVCEFGIGKIDRIMLDNFSPSDIAIALELISNKFETEASGGINLNNIQEYATTGIDFISVGALTHQAKSVDFSLKAVLI